MSKKVALIFPGQGAQKVGMGREFYDASPEAKAVFERANALLGEDLTRIIFDGPEDKLTFTAYCQPAIFTMSMAALAALKASGKLNGTTIVCAAGLSLGEYGAIHAAGSLSFEECFKLIQKRAAFMEEAAKASPGKMAAVIGFDQGKLLEICRVSGAEVANFNAPDQIVITGAAAAVGKACQMLSDAGCRKVIPLEVSGAFHSTLMKPAAAKFAQALAGVPLKVTDIEVIANVNARPQATPEEMRVNLASQICSSVQWVDSVRTIASRGITELIEVGPGRVLKGLIRKIEPALNVHNVQTPGDIPQLPF